MSSVTKSFYVSNILGRAVNHLNNKCRALLCLALLLAYFLGVRRPEILLRSKRDQKGRQKTPFPTFLLPYIQPIQQGSDVDLLIDPAMRLTNEVPCVVDKLSFEMGKEEIITKPFATINSLGCLGGFKIELGV